MPDGKTCNIQQHITSEIRIYQTNPFNCPFPPKIDWLNFECLKKVLLCLLKLEIMEDCKQQETEKGLSEEKLDETRQYMEMLDDEIWDEALRSYNDILFTLLRYS
jgi:hypothetical protein